MASTLASVEANEGQTMAQAGAGDQPEIPEIGPSSAAASDALPMDSGGESQGEATEILPAGPAMLRTEILSQHTDELYPAETFIPVHGQVRISAREVLIINHPAFQRLFEFHQLGQTHLVFRGATHARGEHAIGTLSVAQMFAEAIVRNTKAAAATAAAIGRVPQSPASEWKLGQPLSATELAFARLGALLHDIGHLPMGHTLEDELAILPLHDGTERLETVLDQEEWRGIRRATLRSLIDQAYNDLAQQTGLLDDYDQPLSGSEVFIRLVSKDHDASSIRQASTHLTDFRWGVLRDIIGNTICADLLDYLHRDWLHIGRPRYFDTRILDYFEIRTRSRRSKPESQLVLNLGTADKPRPDAITMALDLLESRYQLSEIVLFHRTKLAAAAMLERALAEYQDSYRQDGVEREEAAKKLEFSLLACSDSEAYELMINELGQRRSQIRTSDGKMRVAAGIDLLQRLRLRELHKDFASFWVDDLRQSQWVQEQYAPDMSLKGPEAREDRLEKSERRLTSLRGLEYDLGLRPGSIVMYCPSAKMNSKIARVSVFRQGSVTKLDALDQEATSGHLGALDGRFRRLWRVQFAMDRLEYARFEKENKLDTIRDVILYGVLGQRVSHGDPDQKMGRLAAELYGEDEVDPTIRIASETDDSNLRYSSGRRMLRSFRKAP